ncbi:MAG: hypothetical protein IMY85_02695, partial [Chloroflexi bacterium]|nr:hypothetical protein [Chloroflexota bacterium]
RGPDLLARTDNARRAIADRYVRRGDILDRENIPLVGTEGAIGDYSRVYNFPKLGSLVGYSHAVYGQSGLEASLDPYLRGLRGPSELQMWWNHLLYGQPPPGVDIRLSLDMEMQQRADELLGDHVGALVLLNAGNGELLALASRPTYDPTHLEEIWPELVNDTNTPLINRALQGQYQPGTALGPFLLAALTAEAGMSQVPEIELSGNLEAGLDCATPPADTSWAEVITAGCTLPQITLSQQLGDDALLKLYDDLGLFTVPNVDQTSQQISAPPIIRSPVEVIRGQSEFLVSPLQMALAAATLSTGGSQPATQLVSAVNLPETGWTVFPPAGEAKQVFSQLNADGIAVLLADDNLPIWQIVARTPNEADQVITWYLAGTLPTWTGAPFSLVIILEEDDPEEALAIGQAMMESALQVE